MSSYNPYRKYCPAWWRYWLNLPSDIFGFLERVRAYAPLLWEDRDFDYAYLLRLMRFKIRRMRACMERNAHIAHAEDCVAEMAAVDVLLRNVVDEDPDDEWSMHHSQWHHGVDLNEPCPASPQICRQATISSVRRERRNWRKLWQYLAKHTQGWWD